MGHDHHFLERLDRVSIPHLDFALGLYRDHELIRFVLSEAKVPENAARVAIAVGDAVRGPFLVVARDGAFVTCLGEGMSHGQLPIVTRAQLDGLSVRYERLRERLAAAGPALANRRRTSKLLRRIFQAGPDLAREEFLDIAALEPIYRRKFLSLLFEAVDDVGHTRKALGAIRKPTHDDEALLKAYWERLWGAGHLYTLAFIEGARAFDGIPGGIDAFGPSISWGGIRQGISGIALRAAWASAKLGKEALAIYKRAWIEAESGFRMCNAGFSLAAIGMRHARLRGEVEKSLSTPRSADESDPYAVYLHAFYRFCQALLRGVLGEADAIRDEYLVAGRRFGLQLASRYPALGWKDPEDVPDDVAVAFAGSDDTAFLAGSEQLQGFAAALPWAARAAPEDFYLPRSVVKELRVRWTPEASIALLDGIRTALGYEQRAKAAPKKPDGPTRNGPCPCGSGKKYKRCCM